MNTLKEMLCEPLISKLSVPWSEKGELEKGRCYVVCLLPRYRKKDGHLILLLDI